MAFSIETIARVCHEANRAICQATGDNSQVLWPNAAEWQKDSAISGVKFAIANPEASASAQHEAWLADKIKDGWIHGEVKDAVAKTHPCIVPYDELPMEQRAKDVVFKAIVNALVGIKELSEPW